MTPILHPIFALLASVTRQELARQVAYLKEENRILRARLPERLIATPEERRRLLKVGRKLGVQLRNLISIVSYQTFVRWIREKEDAHTAKQTKRKPGRPRTPDDIRELVLKLARENDWGYTRILGELRKLGIRSISRQTVKMILKEHGIDSGPQRGKGSWEARLRRRPMREDAGRAAVAIIDPRRHALAMRFLVEADMDSQRIGRCVPAGVSASWFTPSVDFTEHRAAGLGMGQPAGSQLPDGGRRHGPRPRIPDA
jgi:transposase